MKMNMFLILVLFGVHSVLADTNTASSISLKPNPVFQQKLETFVAFYYEQVKINPEMPEEEVDSHLSEFLKNSGLVGGELFTQLAIALKSQATLEHDLMVQELSGEDLRLAAERCLGYNLLVRVLLGAALEQSSAQDIVMQTAPYYELEISEDLRQRIDHVLDTACVLNGRHRPDYRAFVSYMKCSKDIQPKKLIRYMFQVNPDKALSEVEKVYAPKTKRPSEQFKGDSIRKVRSVATGNQWWQELYAAEKMRQNKNLRDPELIKQLKKSKHAVVRETIQEIEDTK